MGRTTRYSEYRVENEIKKINKKIKSNHKNIPVVDHWKKKKKKISIKYSWKSRDPKYS